MLTRSPARVLGDRPGTVHAGGGRLAAGGVADLVVFDPQAEWAVRPDALRSQGRHTPFEGYAMPGRVRCTLVAGHVAHEAHD